MSVPSNIALATVTASGRTVTPSGAVFINDTRPRSPATGTARTFTGGVDGTIWDMYAVAAGSNTYTIQSFVHNTDMSARRDAVLLGFAIDYPSLNRTEWVPVTGGALDNQVKMAIDGKYLRVGSLAGGGGETRIDRFGRTVTTPAAGSPPVAGAGIGALADISVNGNDESGSIVVTTLGPAALSVAWTFFFAKPFESRAPWSVMLTPYNLAAAQLARNQDLCVYSNNVFTDHWLASTNVVSLSTATVYVWAYLVRGGY